MFTGKHMKALIVILSISQSYFVNIVQAQSTTAPLVGFVYENCTNNNGLTYPATTGGTLFWDTAEYSSSYPGSGKMNDTYIIKCTVTFTGEPQQTNENYEQFLALYFRQWQLDTSTATTRVNQIAAYNKATNYSFETTPFYDAFQTINSTCGVNCPTGCMILHDPLGPVTTYCGKDILTGTQYPNVWTTQTVSMDFYILGGYYPDNITNGTDYGPVKVAVVDPPAVQIIFDYTSFFMGPCSDLTTQFYCNSTGRCIDRKLYCDALSAVNCGIPVKGTTSTTSDDISYCTSSSTTTAATTQGVTIPQLLGIIIGSILGAALLTIMSLCLFWRPGLLVWMCARLRQGCPKSASNCNRPWTHGNCKGMNCFRSGSQSKVPSNAYNAYNKGDGLHFRECR